MPADPLQQWAYTAAGTQPMLILSLFVLFAVVEIFKPKRAEPKRKSRWTTNLLFWFLNIASQVVLPVTFLSVALWTAERNIGLLNQFEMPLVVLVIANVLGRNWMTYVNHYLFHKVPLFWRVHRVHHMDTEVDVSTTLRAHPLELVIGLACGIPFVLVLGLSYWILLYDVLAVFSIISHSNYSLPQWIERWLRYIVVTPDIHRIHHSSWQPETDSNYSAVFPIFDIIFGTFRTETREPQEKMELGLEVRDGRQNRLGWSLICPFRKLESQQEEVAKEREDAAGGEQPDGNSAAISPASERATVSQ